MSYAGESAPVGATITDEPGSRPRPDQDDPLTAPFWRSAARGELVIQQCGGCRRYHHPPIGLCWECLSTDLPFVTMNGRGSVYSFAVVKDQRLVAFDELTPYVVATVRLEDAPDVLLRTNLPGVPIEQVRAGMPVHVWFEEIAPGCFLPQFQPLGDEGL